ncbi:MAG: PHP domain-containing protein, partial [Clostridia bacterium]|nr:PHP domain-containing protein [Clostridia bacterium]
MKYQAHRGVSSECPENTLSSIERAIRQGYDLVEIDPSVTLDKKIVLLHDQTINRVARKSDGRSIDTPLYIKDLSYKDLLTYDFGLHKSVKFRGEKITLLSEALELSSKKGVTLKIDNKIERFSDGDYENLFSIINSSGAYTAITCSCVDAVKKALSHLARGEIHYDGEISRDILAYLREICGTLKLVVWMPLENSHTSWFKKGFITKEAALLIKEFASLGIWTLYTADELTIASELGADIIETSGNLKPPLGTGALPDMHTHTTYSHDAVVSPEEAFKNASLHGLSSIAFTDHCDVDFGDTRDLFTPLYDSASFAKSLSFSDGATEGLGGIEVAEPLWDMETTEKVVSGYPFDVVLGSVHTVRYQNRSYTYSGTDFSLFSESELDRFIEAYFDEMELLIESFPMDILTHLTCPLRYINGKYKRGLDISRFAHRTDHILKSVIEKGIALEVNTSTYHLGFTMPDFDIIKRYKELGGYLITLASDAHRKENSGAFFKETTEKLLDIGFTDVYKYKDRHAIQCTLSEIKE